MGYPVLPVESNMCDKIATKIRKAVASAMRGQGFPDGARVFPIRPKQKCSVAGEAECLSALDGAL
jgi:hypothetical protein